MKGGGRWPVWKRVGEKPGREGLKKPVPRLYSAVFKVAGSRDSQASRSLKPRFLIVPSFLSCPAQGPSILIYTTLFNTNPCIFPSGQRTLCHQSEVLETVILVNPSADSISSEVRPGPVPCHEGLV